MKKVLGVGLAILLLVSACAAMMSLEEKEKVYGKAAPVITESFASKELLPGDTWKVYLKASDPDGDMQHIAATIEMPGSGMYPVSFTKIPEGNGKELSGYVYLNTMSPYGETWLNFRTLTLTVQIKDRAGHLSNPIAFPLSLQSRYTQALPAPGVFKEESLGPIMIVLRPPENDKGDDYF